MRLLRGRQGLGDNIYQRAVVRELGDVYLETPWPQLYSDLPQVHCVPSMTRLRTQAKNMARGWTWAGIPTSVRAEVIGYAGRLGTMLQGFMETAGIALQRVTFDLPTFTPRPARSRPYVVIRPATVRREWPATARNPDPAYLAMAADMLRQDFDIVSVADLAPGAEVALDPLPFAHERFHAGELNLEALMALLSGAAGAVGGVGWLVPAAMAYRIPLFLIYGGCGQHDGPGRILDHRLPTDLIHHAQPDNFCMCANRGHTCDKRISDFSTQLRQWTVGLAARAKAAVAA